MNRKHIYPCINNFKLLAALLVVAIHVSPLDSISPEADFILTRILARTAVPFFFMVTGYFVLPKALSDRHAAFQYLRRIGLIYLLSAAVYLPVGIYAGHFKGAGLADLLKMFFLDGTFYHLWYLPALLLGFCLALFLLRALPLPAAGAAAVLLYAIGLLGDSYYGLISDISWIRAFYNILFQIFEYTRNGLFYAPLFLLLGFLASARKRPGDYISLLFLGFSFALLLTEGIVLQLFKLQRHDSMYVSLPLLMYFLFCALLDGKLPDISRHFPKNLSLLIYLLHPLFIILVRGASKLTGWKLLTDNSLIHYLAVAASTFLFSWALLLFSGKIRSKIKSRRQKNT